MKWILLCSFLILSLFSVFEIGRPAPQDEALGDDGDRVVSTSQELVFASGRVEGVSAEIELFTTIRELVTAIPVVEGQTVQSGQLLVQLDNRLQLAELELAKAGVSIAEAEKERVVRGPTQSERDEAHQQTKHRQAEMISAARMLERGLLLAKTNAISSTDIEEFESRSLSTKALFEAAKAHEATICAPARKEDLDAATARLAAAKARLNLAETALSKTRIVAPSNGQILQINLEVGELPSAEPLVIMADTETLQVRAHVDEFDALRVHVGQTVRLQCNAMRDSRFYGRVVRTSPRMQNKDLSTERPGAHLDTRSREIWVEIEPGTPLIVGLPVELWIGESIPNAPTI